MASITLFQAPQYDQMNPTLSFLLVGFGLPGMLVMMQLAQLAPQVLASRHTKQFLDIPGGRGLVALALGIELLGITECANAVKLLVERCCCAAQVVSQWKPIDSHPSDIEDGGDEAKRLRMEDGTDDSSKVPSTATATTNPLLVASASESVGK